MQGFKECGAQGELELPAFGTSACRNFLSTKVERVSGKVNIAIFVNPR